MCLLAGAVDLFAFPELEPPELTSDLTYEMYYSNGVQSALSLGAGVMCLVL